MKNIKKIFVVMLCLCIVVCGLATTASAAVADFTDGSEYSSSSYTGSGRCKKGGSHKWKVTSAPYAHEEIRCTKCGTNETRSHSYIYKSKNNSVHQVTCKTCSLKSTEKHSLRYVKSVQATCKKAGYHMYKCTKCPYVYYKTIAKTSHKYKTIYKKGKAIGRKCTVCGSCVY